MSINRDLQLFGFNEQEQQVYLLLARLGWSTILQLSKLCQIKRTTLYRIIGTLTDRGYIQVQVGDKTTFYNIASPESFETSVLESENKIKQMKESIIKIKEYTHELMQTKLDQTVLLYYKGIRGLKQMEYNVRAGTPNIEWQVFDSTQWAKVVGKEFAENMRQECVEKNIRLRGISNFEEPIAPDGTTGWTSNKIYATKNYRHRLISKQLIDIKQDIFVMPDSIIFWGVKTNDEVAIQIKNSDYATMMRQIFEYLWNQAKVIDNFGERFNK
ncbi:MAG: Transcriptional regulator, TrmB [Candidatus Roizmanbacteria bacterium GW2011_GWA2_36_23]|uniref:Transcriptional regulator, TrmB n=1 Tax=Candidatus Roizmanbacteria bacterium GW2011_GWA2_36_23 TaxID=1618480 RepID=A0A0G0E4Y0_9BACT|nr:MAG: Transcriptional regulator, TrmB [Candidatus Roizmanbacteria bacterium GW2011_GWA2_36_23]